ncbi:hypothetical protein DITRI_Ditri07aG0157400 [Diplodiscus trichospermus]
MVWDFDVDFEGNTVAVSGIAVVEISTAVKEKADSFTWERSPQATATKAIDVITLIGEFRKQPDNSLSDK